MTQIFKKPGWLFALILIIIFVILAFTVLAPWQLGKNRIISAENRQVEKVLNEDPVDLSSISSPATEEDQWRRVTFSGSYIPDSRIIVRMRSVNSTPAYQALAVARTTTGDLIIINQGYVTTNNISHIPALESGVQNFSGYIRLTETNSADPINADGFTQVNTINTEQIMDILGLSSSSTASHNFYVQLAQAPAPLQSLPQPEIKTGPYLSYGIQWIAFGILAPIGFIYFIYSDIRERRREKEELAELALLKNKEKTEPSEEPSAQPKPRARARYGKPNHFEKVNKKNEERF